MEGYGFAPVDTVEGAWVDVSFQRRTLETAWRTAWIADLVPAEKLTEKDAQGGDGLILFPVVTPDPKMVLGM